MDITVEKLRKPLLIGFAVIAGYALLGFLIVPALIKAHLPETVQQQTGKPATVSAVKFNPFTFELLVQGFEMTEPAGEKIIALQDLYVNFSTWSSIRHWAVAFDKIYLNQPFVDIVVRKDGSLNLIDLVPADVPEQAPPQVAEKPFPVWLERIRINDGSLSIADLSLSKPYHKNITDLSLDIDKLATFAVQEQGEDHLSLTFANGGGLKWNGDVELAPIIIAQGHIAINDLNSEIVWDYVSQRVGFNIKQGNLDLDSDYIFQADEQQTVLAFSGSKLALTDVLDDGGSLEWQGDISVLPQLQSKGKIQLHHVSLGNLWRYIPETVEFRIDRGELNLQTDYALQTDQESPRQLQLELLNSKAVLTDVLDQGDSLIWQGETTVMPVVKSTGNLVIDQLNLNRLWRKLPQYVDLQVLAGSLNLRTDYNFEMRDDQPGLGLAEGHVKLAGVRLSAKQSQQAVVEVNDLSVQGLAFDLQKQQIDIAGVTSDQAKVQVELDRQGELNLAKMFTGKALHEADKRTEQAIPEAAGKPWRVNIGYIKARNYGVDFTQQMEGKPVEMKFSPIDIAIDDFSNAPGKKFSVQAALGVGKSGKITAQGMVSADPVNVKMGVKASALALRPLQPYLDRATRLKLVRGDVYLDSKIDLSLADKKKTALEVSGDASVNNLKTVAVQNNKDFLKWRKLGLNTFRYTLDPPALKISAVDVDGLVTEVIINKDKTTNFDAIFAAPQSSSAVGQQEATPVDKTEQPLAVNIGKVKINNAAGFFADRSLILPFAANIQQLNGAIKNISTNRQSRATVYLEGKADETAPLLIQGNLEPFAIENHLDILMRFDGMNMTGLTPYVAQFAGYKVEKGKLSVDLQYKIENKQLTANNKVVINQLTLGEEVDSPDSVSLPVKLAIALLKGPNGVIDLDLPLKGDMNDPDFSVLGLLGDVLLNLITKAATSPFALMESLLDTEADLSKIHFSAGSAELSQEQKQILDTIAEGLDKRPELQLEIRGVAYREQDSAGLAELAVMNQIKSIAWQDLDNDERPAVVADTPLSEKAYRDILSDVYEEQFGDQAERLVDLADDAPDAATADKYYAQMKQQLVDATPVNDYDLDYLAMRRADAIVLYITEHDHVPAERVYIVGQTVRDTAENNEIVVDLKLGAAG